MARIATQTPTPFELAPTLYPGKPGDTLTRIVSDYYGILPTDRPAHQQAQDWIMRLNPQLHDRHRIYAGQVLRLSMLPPAELFAEAPSLETRLEASNLEASNLEASNLEASNQDAVDLVQRSLPQDPAEREAFRLLALLQAHHSWLTLPLGIGLSTFGHLVGPGNLGLVQTVEQRYHDYRAGRLSQNQYAYQRRKLLQQFARNVRLEKLLFKGQTTFEAIRINRSRAIPATHSIASHVTRLSRLARLAKGGGVVLTGVGAVAACGQIGATADRQLKNEILVETVGSTLASGITGYIIATVMMGTPIGWGLALVLATGTTVTGLAAGWSAKKFYNRALQEVDLVSVSGIDRLC